MNYNYALITDGIVSNIIVLHPGNVAAFPTAVPMNDYPVTIGDTYDGQHFFRNGEQLKTEKERLQEVNASLMEAFDILGVDIYNLQEDSTDE